MIGMPKMIREMYGTWERIRLTLPIRKTPRKVLGMRMKGARGGILMLAEPKVGIMHDQEFTKDVAEDKATVLSLNGNLSVPYGSFSNVIKPRSFQHLSLMSLKTNTTQPT